MNGQTPSRSRRVSIAAALAFALAPAAGGQVKTGVSGGAGKPKVGIGLVEEDQEKAKQRIRRRFDLRIADAREHLARQRWADAKRDLDLARSCVVDRSQIPELTELYNQLSAEGFRQFREAEQAYEKQDYREALRRYGVICRTFGELPAGLAAARALKMAEKDPAARLALREERAAELDRKVARILSRHFEPAEATTRPARPTGPATRPATQPSRPVGRVGQIKLLPVKNQAKVVDLLERAVKLYEKTSVGLIAAEDLAKLEADEGFQARLARYRTAERARGAFRKAEVYRKAGMEKKAIGYYRDLIGRYPESPEARKARVRIAELTALKGR